MEEEIQKVQASNSPKEVVRRLASALLPQFYFDHFSGEFSQKFSAKCQEKKVKLAYHVLCETCSTAAACCAKCLKEGSTRQYPAKEDEERAYLAASIEQMRERDRRTFLRQVEKGEDGGNSKGNGEDSEGDDSGSESIPDSGDDEPEDEVSKTLRAATKRARQLMSGEGPTKAAKDAAAAGVVMPSTLPDAAGSDDEAGDADNDVESFDEEDDEDEE